MSANQARINALLRKSLIGELIDTQFYLFSVRSKREGNVTNLQALFANDEALTTGSEYFSSCKPFQNSGTNSVKFRRHFQYFPKIRSMILLWSNFKTITPVREGSLSMNMAMHPIVTSMKRRRKRLTKMYKTVSGSTHPGTVYPP